METKRNFSLYEFFNSTTAQIYNIINVPNDMKVFDNVIRLMDRLELVRLDYDNPIIVTSGYRCSELNKRVGGVENSLHLQGLAADICPCYYYKGQETRQKEVLQELYEHVLKYEWKECYVNYNQLYIHVAI